MNQAFNSRQWELINLTELEDKLGAGSALIWWEDTFEACMKVAQYEGATSFRIDWVHKQVFTTGIES